MLEGLILFSSFSTIVIVVEVRIGNSEVKHHGGFRGRIRGVCGADSVSS